MITEREIEAVELSATKKDFYQIWNELLDTAGKLSERWDPTSTNESDPGIVLLKVLTAIADKLNYNIDKNTLEAFMPSATQEESMRKLCDMLGYSMKYYRSATTDVTITFNGDAGLSDADEVQIDRFTNIKDAEDSINYVTLAAKYISGGSTSVTVSCIEGEAIDCETDNDNFISLSLLDDNQRYFLPETQIAENGVFIFSHSGTSQTEWTRVDNLNIQPNESKVFKFGFDSRERLPYIQFPEDISAIIEDGITIKYIRTNGINGNVAAKKLTVLSAPASWSAIDTTTENDTYTPAVEDFIVSNAAAATNGRNPETINQAYTNYKKTIGTFDTLVTCRDYMNKIYQMTVSETDTSPLVSNIIVSDIRDDINKSITICTFNEFGLSYIDNTLVDENNKALISNFDLILYPFKVFFNAGGILETNTALTEYVNSFKYSGTNLNAIQTQLENYKTISHVLKAPEENDIVCIKNYLTIKAKIATTRKVNSAERAIILKTVYRTLAEQFNLRNLDFGEEIDFDDILACIKNADARIKNVIMEEPDINTKICLKTGDELDFTDSGSTTYNEGCQYYNKLALQNVLAGRIPLFDYDTNFRPSFKEKAWSDGLKKYKDGQEGETVYITALPSSSSLHITSMSSNLAISDTENYTILENQHVIFKAPKLKTDATYPAYVNYYLTLNTGGQTPAVPAEFESFVSWLNTKSNDVYNGVTLANSAAFSGKVASLGTLTEDAFTANKTMYGMLFIKSTETSLFSKADEKYGKDNHYYAIVIKADTLSVINNQLQTSALGGITGHILYRSIGTDLTRPVGNLVDANHTAYRVCNVPLSTVNYADSYFLPVIKDGTLQLGSNGSGQKISANTEYQLTEGEKLYINYTSTATSDDGTETKTIHNEVFTANSEINIIKPNFDLYDSKAYVRLGHSSTKTVKFDDRDIPMFTLGTNEQIETRYVAKTELDLSYCNVYWTRNDETKLLKDNKITWDWDGSETDAVSNITTYYYILKENEYFFFTDYNKTNIAYYGSGTKISAISGKVPSLYKDATATQPTLTDIVNLGTDANIPWQAVDLSTNKLTLTEYQFVDLSEGYKIVTKINDNSDGTGVSGISSNPIEVANVNYIDLDGSTRSLPTLSINSIKWTAQTLLDFNMGPKQAQTLHRSSKMSEQIIVYQCTEVDGVLTPSADDTFILESVVKTSGEIELMLVKSNYTCQSSGPSVSTIYSIYDINSESSVNQYDFKLQITKAGTTEDIKYQADITNSSQNLHKFLFTSIVDDNPLCLCVSVPTDKTGLLMIYYTDPTYTIERDIEKLAYIEAVGGGVSIYNHDGWWKENEFDDTKSATDLSKNYLRPGLNIVKLVNTTSDSTTSYVTSLKIHRGHSNGSIIFSDLDIINGINSKIDYKKIDKATEEAQILYDIQKLDPDYNFYYNNIVDNSILIDMHEDAKLSSAEPWYDYNNKANKFVVSELAADTFKDYITLTTASLL